MIDIPDFLPDNQKMYLRKAIENSKYNEKAIVAVKLLIDVINLVETFAEGKGRKVLKGAHIVFASEDIYKTFINETDTRYRISSHYKREKIEEKGVNLKNSSDLLIGLNKDNKSWLQIENNKVSFVDGILSGIGSFFLHMIDFIQYKWTSKNLGPCGKTKYTEANPIVIPDIYCEDLKLEDSIEDLIFPEIHHICYNDIDYN